MTDIEMLVARQKIEAQLYTYCKGIDTRDWELVRSCFDEEHVHQHRAFKGSIDEFIGFASGTMSKVKTSQHEISNLVMTISEDGLSADTEAYFNAIHLIEAKYLPDMHFYKESYDGGQCRETDWIVAGIYKDKWVFRDGGWLIVNRVASHSWERVEPSSS